MPTVIHHMQANIEGLLRAFKGKRGDKLSFMDKEDGTTATYNEAREYLLECQKKGWKVIPCNADCEGFDYMGSGCPGHEVKEES